MDLEDYCAWYVHCPSEEFSFNVSHVLKCTMKIVNVKLTTVDHKTIVDKAANGQNWDFYV